MRYVFVVFASVCVLFAAEPERRIFYTDTPPSAVTPPADLGKQNPNVKVIRRVYRLQDQNGTSGTGGAGGTSGAGGINGAASAVGYRYFVGVGGEFLRRERTINIKTNNSGRNVDVGDAVRLADGSTYTMSKNSNESFANAELGIVRGGEGYYGVKLGFLDDFVELSLIGGYRMQKVELAGFVPFLEVAGSIGYEDSDGFTPDNLAIGVYAGADRKILGDYLYLKISAFYKHRYWQNLEMVYGDEDWQDNEIGLGAGLRYLF